MKCQILFIGKNKDKISKCCLPNLKLAQRVVKVKDDWRLCNTTGNSLCCFLMEESQKYFLI